MDEISLERAIKSLGDRLILLHQFVSELPGAQQQSEQLTKMFEEIETSLKQLEAVKEELDIKAAQQTRQLKQAQERLLAEIDQRQQVEAALGKRAAMFHQLAENIREVFFISAADLSQILYISPTYEELWGRTTQSLYEQPHSWLEAVHPDERDRIIAAFEIAARGEAFQEEYRIIRPDGSVRWILARSFPARNEGGELSYHVGIAEDITERKRVEEDLRQNQRLIQRIADTSPQMLYIYDLATGSNLYVNRQIVEILGYRPEELRQAGTQFFLDNVHPEDLHLVRELPSRFAKVSDGEVVEIEYRIGHKKGSWRWLRSREVVFTRGADGSPKQILGTALDITSRKLIEMALWESESRLHTIVNSISDGILLVDRQGIVRFVNPAALNLFGRPLEELLDQEFGKPMVVGEMAQLDVSNPELGVLTLEMRIAQTVWQGEPIYVVALRDITQRRQAEIALRDSEERFRQLAENIEDVFWLFCPQTEQLLYVSPACEKIWGRSCESLYAQPYNWLDVVHPEDRETARAGFERKRQREPTTCEYRIVRPDGEIRWISDRAFPVKNEGGEVYRIAEITEDISDRKRSEEQIRASLREKEVLLKEIHHRVKNNLQIISSLLRLQANRIDDPLSRSILQDSQNRVESMALVHESLYRSMDFSRINFTQYVQTLAANLFRTYNVQLEPNSFKMHVEDGIFISLAQAIPCGLIINELIGNALKHGLANSQDGEVWLILEAMPHRQVVLRVGNKGDTLPADFDLAQSQSMGLKLVMTLVKQLKGTIELETGDKTVFKVIFTLSD
ncbi:MAG TPA: hypothetical protein DDZ80_16990 [Cyanobacteria bacterium UBA8803]|nr:hypothetical protein [Cyanobacteria bacterium UBA9273]HBL60094.1 hypothetical protein [Cyanobacteria bacterium UBA8803]